MISPLLSLLRLVPATWLVGALAFGALAGWHFIEKNRAYHRGWAAAMATVERMNERAAESAREAQGAVDYCFDMGGTWDATRAACRLP